MNLHKLSGEQLRCVLKTGTIDGQSCTTIEDLFVLSLRKFIHEYCYVYQNKTYRSGSSLLGEKHSTEAWYAFLRRAFGDDAVNPLILITQSEDTSMIVKNPMLLRLYLNHGYFRDIENSPRLKHARDYLEIPLRQLVKRVILRPPGRLETRFFNLLNTEKGQDTETFLRLLIRAFGKEAVREAIRGIPRYRVLLIVFSD